MHAPSTSWGPCREEGGGSVETHPNPEFGPGCGGLQMKLKKIEGWLPQRCLRKGTAGEGACGGTQKKSHCWPLQFLTPSFRGPDALRGGNRALIRGRREGPSTSVTKWRLDRCLQYLAYLCQTSTYLSHSLIHLLTYLPVLGFSRQDFSVWPCLSWSSVHRSDWP